MLFSWVMAISVPHHVVVLFYTHEILHCCVETWASFPWLQSKFVPEQVVFLCCLDASCLGQMNSFKGQPAEGTPAVLWPAALWRKKHRGRTLKEQLLHIILLLFTQCSPLAAYPLTAAEASSAVRSLHPVYSCHELCKDTFGAAFIWWSHLVPDCNG